MDVTADQDATESEARSVLQAIPAGIYETDAAGSCVFVNEAWIELTGIPFEKALGNGWQEALHPEDRVAARELWPDGLRRRSQLDRHFRILRSDGSMRHVLSSANPLVDPNGELKGFIGILTDVTERERHAAERRNQRVLLSRAEQISDSGTWRVVPETGEVWWSEQVYHIHGVDPKTFELNFASAVEAYHPEDRKVVRKHIEDAMKTGCGFEFELRLCDANGQIRYVKSIGEPEFDEQGQIVALIGVFRDITREKQYRLEIEKSEQKFRDLVEGSIQGHCVHAEYRPLFVNRAFAQMLGFDNIEEVLSLPSILPFMPQHVQQNSEQIWDRHLTGRRMQFFKRTDFVRQNGDRFWADTTGRVISWDGGVAVQITLVDVTEQVLAEEQLAEQKEKLEIATRGACIGIWHRYLDSDDLYWSEELYAMTGFDSSNFHPDMSFLRSHVHPDDWRLVAPSEYRKIGGEEDAVRNSEFRFRHADGHYIWMRSRGQLFSDANGKPIRFAGSVWDVTAERRAQEELIDAKARAEEASRIKGEFLAKMSHEIRTPLNSVLGMTYLLMDSRLDSKSREYAAAAHASGHQLLELFTDVLDFSALDAGNVDLTLEDAKLTEQVAAVVDGFRESAKEKNLILDLQISDELGWAYKLDGDRLGRVLSNLVSNAIKFTERGQICVRVRLSEASCVDEHAYDLVRFEVIDTGVGISDDMLPQLFAGFALTQSLASSHYGGTGLGLAICHQLVELMNGKIGVESCAGHGSTFWFEVPLSRSSGFESTNIEKCA